MRYRTITSPSNPVIKEAISVKERKKRSQNRLLIEGQHLLEMALSSGAEIARVFFTGHYKSKNERFLKNLSKRTFEFIETTEQVLSKLSDTEAPQGIAAIVTYRSYALSELSLKVTPLLVICDGVQDPGNLGTIIRTSDAAGADAVMILHGTCDPFLPKVTRSSAGSIFNLPVIFSESDRLIEWLRERGIGILVTEAHASKTIYETDLRKPLAFVFGNEASGVSKTLKEKGDILLRIPIQGKAESLNVATSAAVCLYEAVRQRKAMK